jgi:16S rRNA (guanine966-N2)-methyltransferase
MRIISGKHRGRKIITSDKYIFRPTTTKTREAIFSILTSGEFLNQDGDSVLDNATIMDLCCASGSLGLEAISRGAAKVIAIDIEQDSLNVVKENARAYGEIDNFIVIRADACALPKAKISCDVVFIDPPYEKNIISFALESLHKQGWLKENAVVVVELDNKQNIEANENFEITDHRIYSKTQIYILSYIGTNEAV